MSECQRHHRLTSLINFHRHVLQSNVITSLLPLTKGENCVDHHKSEKHLRNMGMKSLQQHQMLPIKIQLNDVIRQFPMLQEQCYQDPISPSNSGHIACCMQCVCSIPCHPLDNQKAPWKLPPAIKKIGLNSKFGVAESGSDPSADEQPSSNQMLAKASSLDVCHMQLKTFHGTIVGPTESRQLLMADLMKVTLICP